MGLRAWVRWVVVGRRDGVRSRMRRRLGVFTWVDEDAPVEGGSGPVSVAPAPVVPEQDGWIRVLELSDVGVGEVVEVLAEGRPVAIANVGGALYAVDSVCPHAGGPLGDGSLEDCVLTCPWHGWSFDVRTGRTELSEDVVLETLPCEVRSGAVYVREN